MAITYFGKNEDGAGAGNISGYTNYNNHGIITYTCPGTGTQNVKELGARCFVYGGGSGNIRIAIYNTSLDLIYQGSAEINVSNGTTETWYTHTAFVDSAGSPVENPVLTGGTDYILALTGDGSLVTACRDVGTTGDHKYIAADYTEGFPTPISAGNDSASRICVRCGVEPIAGGTAYPVIDLGLMYMMNNK